jgi:hypothetical protein
MAMLPQPGRMVPLGPGDLRRGATFDRARLRSGVISLLPMGQSNHVVLRELAYARVEDVLILCTAGDTPDEDLTTFLNRLATRDYLHLMVVSRNNAALSSKQRSRVADVVKTVNPKVVMLSNSAVARCVATGIAWLAGNPFKAMAIHEHKEALAFFGSKASPNEIARTIDALCSGLAAKERRTG